MTEPVRMVAIEDVQSAALTRGHANGLEEAAEYLDDIGDEAGAAHFRGRAKSLREGANIREGRAMLRAARAALAEVEDAGR